MDETVWLADRCSRRAGAVAGGGLPDARLGWARPMTPSRRPGCGSAGPRERVDNVGGWLTTIVARCSSTSARPAVPREQPLDCTLPDPIVEPGGGSIPRTRRCWPTRSGSRCSSSWNADPVRAARLRAARHVRLPFEEIAPMVDRSPQAARQLASRARRRVRAQRRDPTSTPHSHREVVDAFLAAPRDGDFDAWWRSSTPTSCCAPMAARPSPAHRATYAVRWTWRGRRPSGHVPI